MIQRMCWQLILACALWLSSPCAHSVDKDSNAIYCLWFFIHTIKWNCMLLKINTTFNNGSLGSRIDEERSELRYVMWIAEFSESSNLWTHIAPSSILEGMPVWVSLIYQPNWDVILCLVLGWWRLLESTSAPFKCISRTLYQLWFDNNLSEPLMISNSLASNCLIWDCPTFGHYFDLTSNQVGLPAELKHINKRRKRN